MIKQQRVLEAIVTLVAFLVLPGELWAQRLTRNGNAPASARILLRSDYVGVVLSPQNEPQGKPLEGPWFPTDEQIARLESHLADELRKRFQDRGVVDKMQRTYFRQYYGYTASERKKICVTLLSPELVDSGAEVDGTPSPALAIKLLASVVFSVWDAGNEWQQYFFDVEDSSFTVNE